MKVKHHYVTDLQPALAIAGVVKRIKEDNMEEVYVNRQKQLKMTMEQISEKVNQKVSDSLRKKYMALDKMLAELAFTDKNKVTIDKLIITLWENPTKNIYITKSKLNPYAELSLFAWHQGEFYDEEKGTVNCACGEIHKIVKTSDGSKFLVCKNWEYKLKADNWSKLIKDFIPLQLFVIYAEYIQTKGIIDYTKVVETWDVARTALHAR
jgi:hypothetical protein